MNSTFLCVLDNDDNQTVPPRDQWLEVQSNSHLNAATEFCAGCLEPITIRLTLVACRILVALREGWPGVTIHVFVVKLKGRPEGENAGNSIR